MAISSQQTRNHDGRPARRARCQGARRQGSLGNVVLAGMCDAVGRVVVVVDQTVGFMGAHVGPSLIRVAVRCHQLGTVLDPRSVCVRLADRGQPGCFHRDQGRATAPRDPMHTQAMPSRSEVLRGRSLDTLGPCFLSAASSKSFVSRTSTHDSIRKRHAKPVACARLSSTSSSGNVNAKSACSVARRRGVHD